MSANKHTPGPWVTVETDVGQIVVEDVNGWICEMGRWHEQDNLANAHLISAAPDMLEAADALIHRVAIPHDSPERIALVAAIKKARGEK